MTIQFWLRITRKPRSMIARAFPDELAATHPVTLMSPASG